MNASVQQLLAWAIDRHLPPYARLSEHAQNGPRLITRGDGVYVIDTEGRRYLEGMAGLWSASLGFSESRLAEAAYQQMKRLPFYHTFFNRAPDVTIKLAKALTDLAPTQLTRAFFANSGSEAADTAIKLIWYYNNAVGRPKKKKIVSRFDSYHGVTVATASLTAIPLNQQYWDLPLPGFLHITSPHYYRQARPGEFEDSFTDRLARELEDTIQREGPDTVAAIFAEPVQAAGGVIVPPPNYFAKIQPILKKYDVLLVADEVVCGFGRTGTMFGTETFGLVPDMMIVAKSLSASYLPISALLITDDIYNAIERQSEQAGAFGHGYTYSGHPVCAAVALETLKIYAERDVIGHVRNVSKRFQERLTTLGSHELVGEARGVGLIGAVELVRDKATKAAFDAELRVGPRAVEIAMRRGLILRARGDILTICPPLIITEAEIDELFDILTATLDEISASLSRAGWAAASA